MYARLSLARALRGSSVVAAMAAASRAGSIPSIWPGRSLLQTMQKRLARDQQACPGILQSEAQPCIRPGRVQGNIGCTRAHDAQSRDDPVERPLHAQGHSAVGTQAPLHQVGCKSIRCVVELCVGKLTVAVRKRYGVWGQFEQCSNLFRNGTKIYQKRPCIVWLSFLRSRSGYRKNGIGGIPAVHYARRIHLCGKSD